MSIRKRAIAAFTALACMMQPVAAQAQQVGRETGFAIPRFVSMRSSKANIRRGPTLGHKIDWVFDRAGLPVVVRGEFGHWRLIEDAEGDGGWVHRALISGATTGLVVKDEVPVYSAPTEESDLIAKAKKDLIFEITECVKVWCKISRNEKKGWVRKSDVWGVDPSQID